MIQLVMNNSALVAGIARAVFVWSSSGRPACDGRRCMFPDVGESRRCNCWGGWECIVDKFLVRSGGLNNLPVSPQGDTINVRNLYIISSGTLAEFDDRVHVLWLRILTGEVIITKRDKVGSSESKVVHVARPTECFGELALLYNHPRAATVKVRFWFRLPRALLKHKFVSGGSWLIIVGSWSPVVSVHCTNLVRTQACFIW